MSPRDTILGAVRQQLDRTSAAPPPPPPPLPLLGRLDSNATERVTEFWERLEAVGGVVHRGDAIDTVREVVARHRPRTIAGSDAPQLDALRRDSELADVDWLPANASQEQLFAADLGITTAQWGIAETGTLVLDSSAERSGLASLLPPVHIALLPISRILANLGELLKTVSRPLPAALTFVTGPSRTADIELQLVLGVHGPRELHVVLV